MSGGGAELAAVAHRLRKIQRAVGAKGAQKVANVAACANSCPPLPHLAFALWQAAAALIRYCSCAAPGAPECQCP
jgi:hypothetical protein